MSVAGKNNKEKEAIVLSAIRKEVDEDFAETDSIFIGMDEYPKSTLLLAIDEKSPTLMTLLVDPATQRIDKKPEEEKLLLLYLGETSSSETQGQRANPTSVDGREYLRGELLLDKKFPPRNISLGNEKKTCLLINPVFDPVSKNTCAWSVALIPVLKAKGWDVTTIGGGEVQGEIEKREVRRAEVERAIEERNPELIIFYGHGGPDRLMGSGTKAVFSIGNAKLFKDREVYTNSCLSAIILGKKAVRMGCKAYWGSIIPVFLPPLSGWAFRMHQNDGILEKIMTPQLSWGDAFDHTFKVGEALIKFLLAKGKPLEAFMTLSNNNGLRVYVGEEKK